MQDHNNECVSILIPNLNGLKHLKICLPSIMNQTYTDIELIVVDNGSRDGSVDYLNTIPSLKLARNERNLGFAKAVNQAARIASGYYLFVLNNDTALDPKCVETLVREFRKLREKGISVAGLSPKILFYDFPTVIDAVGTGMNADGTGYNIGVGQIDLGQFDSPSRMFGLCFAAAFLAGDSFERVGPLEEGYFAYYEDMDWCYRANARGYEFWSAPEAVVYHRHSATARRMMEYHEKRYLLGRNRLRTMLRNYRGKHLLKALLPIANHLFDIYGTLRYPFSRPLKTSLRQLTLNIKVLADLARTPTLLRQNVKLNTGRKIGDRQIWELSEKWRPWLVRGTFLDEAHSPILSLTVIEREYELAAKATRSQELQEQHKALRSLKVMLGKRRWRLDKPEDLRPKEAKGFRLLDFLASSGGDIWFVSKQAQSLATDLFVLDLLLSFHGRDIEEVVSRLERKLRSVIPSSASEGEFPLRWISEQCVAVFASQFEAWGLVSSGGG